MPAESFYKRMQFVTRDSDGVTTPFAGDIDIYIDEDNTLIDTVTTDSDGYIDDGNIPSYLEGTLLRFQSGALTNYSYQTTGLHLEDAYDRNILASFIIDDAYTDTIEPEMVDIFFEDLDEPDVPVQKIGSAAVPGTLVKPFESAFAKNLRFYAVPSGANISGGITNLANAASDSLSFVPDVPVPSGEHIAATFEIDLQETAFQTAFTTPSGFDLYVTKFVFHSPSDNFTAEVEAIETLNAVIIQDVGDFSAETDFIVRVVDVIASRIGSGEDLQFQLTDAISKPGTIKVDVFGYLREAAAEANYLKDDSGNQLTDGSANYYIEG